MKKLLFLLSFFAAVTAGAQTPTATATSTSTPTPTDTPTPTATASATATGTPVPTPTPVALVYRQGKLIDASATGTQPVDNIYINNGGVVGFEPTFGSYFDVGKKPSGSMFARFTGNDIAFISNDLTKAAIFDVGSLTDLRNFDFPDRPGRFALEDGIGITKLGDLTSNGLVTTSGGDGTLGVTGLSTDDTFSAPDDASVPTTDAVSTFVSAQIAGFATAFYAFVLETYSQYAMIADASGSITAGQTAGKYGLGSGNPVIISGTGTLNPLKTIYIAAADYPTRSDTSSTPKLRIRAQLYTNDVAPTGNFTFGLYPITRPGTSGGAGVATYTIGTVIGGSNGATFTTPVADSLLNAVSADFSLPADGYYVIGVVTTATVAASSHVHMNAQLQMHYAF